MRAYTTVWHTTVLVLTIVALSAGGADIGWPSMVGAVGAVTVLGAAAGLAWVEDAGRRWRVVGLLALWFGTSATLVLGLPVVLGVWTLLVVAGLGALCPALLAWALEHRRPPSGDLHQRTTRDLERRWLRTTQEMTARRADPQSVLVLVEERALLLDEMERRDPAGFDAMLVRTGWRERQDR